MKVCPKCGKEAENSASFCSSCGAKLQTAPSGPAFCTSCGAPLKPGAKFCSKCGAEVKSPQPSPLPEEAGAPGPADVPAPAEPEPPAVIPPEPPSPEQEPEPDSFFPIDQSVFPPLPPEDTPPPPKPEPPAPDKAKQKKMLLILIPVAAVLLIGGFLGWRWYSNQALAKELMADGLQYLEDGRYRQAQDKFEELAELQPGNADAVLNLANAYLHQEKYEDAARCLEALDLPADSEQYDSWQRLLGIAQFDPVLENINTENFPRMEFTLRGSGPLQLAEDEVTVLEDGTPYSLSAYTAEDGLFTLSYNAPDTEFSDEQRALSVSLDLDGFVFSLSGNYSTPYFEPAQLQLVSADVSDYPTVTAYFRVENPMTGDPIEGLDAAAFQIYERLQGGEYLAREVRSASPLEGNHGLCIDLVADKSSSISEYDMQKIKRVMTDFVSSLHFEEGDKAEILAFDSIVQQMCYYTNDITLLSNGISNMSTDGLTALYNAIHDGIHNAALQGGARCVIAFTDGMDNMSRYSPSEIVQYANASQVPVYIIGVGSSVDASILRSVAEGTGGRYWFIDDLYDLQEIFNEIYAEQKKLYAVEYVSDGSADPYDVRDLEVAVNGAGYRAKELMSFQATRSVSNMTHTSRYELVKEALSWEDAAKRCQEMGGHLATITSQSEMDQIISMAEANDVRYLWLGGYTSYDSMGNVFGHWVTGEDFSFQPWSVGEPSRVDLDGMDEWYIMLWNIESLGGWTWNDQRNDPAAAVPSMVPRMGFVCEYES